MSKRPPPNRDRFKHFNTVPTRWNDNDPYGHINNAVYYFIFDTAVNTYLIENQILDIAKSQTIGLVAETGCQFFAPLAYPDDIEVGLSVRSIGTSSVTYELGLFAPNAATAAAAGHFTHVYVDKDTRKPQALPDNFRQVLSQIIAG